MITIEGANIQGILKRIQDEIIFNSSELLDQIGELVVFPSIIKNFEDEGRPRWADLTARTNRERKAQGYSEAHPILERTGDLKSSSTEKNGFPGGNYDLQKTVLTISNYLEKAPVLHFGDGLVPARPFFLLQDEDTKKADDVVKKYVDMKLEKIALQETR